MSKKTRSLAGRDDILLRVKAAAPSDNQGNEGKGSGGAR